MTQTYLDGLRDALATVERLPPYVTLTAVNDALRAQIAKTEPPAPVQHAFRAIITQRFRTSREGVFYVAATDDDAAQDLAIAAVRDGKVTLHLSAHEGADGYWIETERVDGTGGSLGRDHDD
jgi:hypothetical protein